MQDVLALQAPLGFSSKEAHMFSDVLIFWALPRPPALSLSKGRGRAIHYIFIWLHRLRSHIKDAATIPNAANTIILNENWYSTIRRSFFKRSTSEPELKYLKITKIERAEKLKVLWLKQIEENNFEKIDTRVV